MNRSILDLKPGRRPTHTTQLDELERDVSMMWDILSTYLHVAVCDNCREEWFNYGGHARGDARGLLLLGKAYCTKCLAQAYEDSTECDDDELVEAYQAIAKWSLFNGHYLPSGCGWSDDPEVKRWRSIMSQ